MKTKQTPRRLKDVVPYLMVRPYVWFQPRQHVREPCMFRAWKRDGIWLLNLIPPELHSPSHYGMQFFLPVDTRGDPAKSVSEAGFTFDANGFTCRKGLQMIRFEWMTDDEAREWRFPP